MSDQKEYLLEAQYLKDCAAIIRQNIETYEKDVAMMNDDIKEMYKRYRDGDSEIFTELSNTITMSENIKMALDKNLRAIKKPYFGRIDIQEQDSDLLECFYIGKGGITKDLTKSIVVDWRAPLANVYYENGLGECSYTTPANQAFNIDLKRKRTYEIDGDKLIDFYDSEVVSNDELLTKYLAKNKEAVLGEIIATIQKEQNDIIRKSPYRSTIVQGVAGSGKTTVAMHRISYILYNYETDFKPEDFYIIGSNRILLNYITSVLPDLDVYGIKQMTMEQLFIRLLYEDWDGKKHQSIACDTHSFHKGTIRWYRLLEAFCMRLEEQTIPQEDIYFNRKVLYSAQDIKKYISDNPHVSIQMKIDRLNERVQNKLKNSITGRKLDLDRDERRRLLREYNRKLGGRKWKRSIYDLYNQFLLEQNENLQRENAFDVYDLAALAYLYKRVKETDPIREAHHILVDEAQDFGMMAYAVLKFCIPDCAWTIMGDISQNIHFGFGLNDWEELRKQLLTHRYDNFSVLSKSYRNTVEISDFAQQILKHGSFSNYAIEPIIRHGRPVNIIACQNDELVLKAAVQLQQWQQEGYDTIAVICRNQEQSDDIAKKLTVHIEIEESDLEKAEFKKGIMVLPVEYTKGLEFDAVLIYNPASVDYPADDGHVKLLYVAATRALHELSILHAENVSGLIG